MGLNEKTGGDELRLDELSVNPPPAEKKASDTPPKPDRPQGLEAVLRDAMRPNVPEGGMLNLGSSGRGPLGPVVAARVRTSSPTDRAGTERGLHFQATTKRPGETVTSVFEVIDPTRPPPDLEPMSRPPTKTPGSSASVLARFPFVKKLLRSHRKDGK